LIKRCKNVANFNPRLIVKERIKNSEQYSQPMCAHARKLNPISEYTKANHEIVLEGLVGPENILKIRTTHFTVGQISMRMLNKYTDENGFILKSKREQFLKEMGNILKEDSEIAKKLKDPSFKIKLA
jgi:hypothetical protein